MAQTIKTETLLIKSDFSYNNEVSCPADQFTELVKVEVPNENIWRFGYGDKDNGVDDRGTYKVVLYNAGGSQVHGKIRFKSRDRNSITTNRGMAPRTEILAQGKNISPQDVRVGASPEKFLVLEFQPDSDQDIDMTNASTEIEAPVTQLQNPDFR